MAAAAGVAGVRATLDLGSKSSKRVQCWEPDSARITGNRKLCLWISTEKRQSRQEALPAATGSILDTGRPQNFGYAHAEPVQVVQTRHHLRIWKADFDIGGQPVWVGAATHDIGFEHDNRSQSATAITHKIDPDVDKERDYVSETLNATGDIAASSKVTPQDPLREAKTATGGTFHSDGQVLVMRVN